MKKDIIIAVIAILAVAAACFALDAIRPDFPLTPSQPFAAKEGKKAANKTGRVIMHVNGEPVTEMEFNAIAGNAPEQNRMFFTSSPEGRRVLANEIVKLKTLEQEARRLGITDDPEVTVQVELTRAQIMANRVLEQLVKDKVDAHMRSEFEKERANTIALRHILVAYDGGQVPPRNGSAPPAAQAMQKASSIAARLRRGADFGELARTESDDQQTSMSGGSLGATRREMLPPEIASVVSKLRIGEISDPVRTAFGIHVFRVDQPTLDDLRPALMRRAQEQAIEETLAKLKDGAKVELDPKFFGTASPAPAGTKSNG